MEHSEEIVAKGGERGKGEGRDGRVEEWMNG